MIEVCHTQNQHNSRSVQTGGNSWITQTLEGWSTWWPSSTQNAVRCIELDAVVVQVGEDLAEVGQLLILVLAGNQDVVR